MSLSLLSFSDDFHRPLQPKKCLTGRYAAAVPSSPCLFFSFYFSFFLGSDLKKGHHRCIVTASLLRFFLPISPPPLLLPARLFVVELRDQLCTRLQHWARRRYSGHPIATAHRQTDRLGLCCYRQLQGPVLTCSAFSSSGPASQPKHKSSCPEDPPFRHAPVAVAQTGTGTRPKVP